MTTTKLSSKNQITIPKKVVQSLRLSSGDRLRLKVEDEKIILIIPSKVLNPTEELYGSVKRKKADVVKAIRSFRESGGRN